MGFSIEAIVGIIALFIALPPAVMILAQLFRRYRSRRALQRESPGLPKLELESAIRKISASAQPSPLHTTSIRIIVEDCNRKRLLEVTQDRQYEEPANLESNLPLLAEDWDADNRGQ
ncbi:hypothetical protein F4679DRAFT_584609 [Xylaria curta]|nr:hypothetical protein F4679DRAFT_584609 [Xylaria curta]